MSRIDACPELTPLGTIGDCRAVVALVEHAAMAEQGENVRQGVACVLRGVRQALLHAEQALGSNCAGGGTKDGPVVVPADTPVVAAKGESAQPAVAGDTGH